MRQYLAVVVAVLALGLFAQSCRSSGGGGGESGAKPQPTIAPPSGATSPTPVVGPSTLSSKMPISITAQGTGFTGTQFDVARTDTVSIQFTISGPTSPSLVAIGLGQGATMQLSNAQTLQPSLSWSAALATQQNTTITLIVRDIAACQRVLAASGGGAQCTTINQSSVADPQYDESKTFTIHIRDFTPGAGSGGLLNAIVGLLQNGGGVQAILPLLQQLSPALAGQLQGGTINLQQLLAILTGGRP